jgi:hypothetical protein
MPTTTRSTSRVEPSAQLDPHGSVGTIAVTLRHRGDTHTQPHVDAVLAVEVGHHRADPGAEHPGKGCDERLDQGDLHAELKRHDAATSAPMKPAPTTSTREPRVEQRSRTDRASSRVRRVCAPDAGRRCRAGHGANSAGGDHQPVERQRRPSASVTRRSPRSSPTAATPSSQVASRRVGDGPQPARRVAPQPEHLLGQGRAVVGRVGLVADHGEDRR